MPVNTETKNAILITDKDAQYDERAKRLLGQKSILAHILVKTVDEFMGMNPKDVISSLKESHLLILFRLNLGLRILLLKKIVSES